MKHAVTIITGGAESGKSSTALRYFNSQKTCVVITDQRSPKHNHFWAKDVTTDTRTVIVDEVTSPSILLDWMSVAFNESAITSNKVMREPIVIDQPIRFIIVIGSNLNIESVQL